MFVVQVQTSGRQESTESVSRVSLIVEVASFTKYGELF